MTTTFSNRNNRRRASEVTTPRKSRTRVVNDGIKEGEFIPFRVVGAEEAGSTTYSDYSTRFELEHLQTKARIKTVVFGDSFRESVDAKILDCILPKDVEDYDLEDLIDGCFEALLVFNTANAKTFVNIKDVRPLQPVHQKRLKQIQQQEQMEQQRQAGVISDVEDELLADVQPSFKEGKSSKQLQSVHEEDLEDLDLDIDDDFHLDLLQDEDEELEVDPTDGEDDDIDDDSCFFCNGVGCEECEEENDGYAY